MAYPRTGPWGWCGARRGDGPPRLWLPLLLSLHCHSGPQDIRVPRQGVLGLLSAQMGSTEEALGLCAPSPDPGDTPQVDSPGLWRAGGAHDPRLVIDREELVGGLMERAPAVTPCGCPRQGPPAHDLAPPPRRRKGCVLSLVPACVWPCGHVSQNCPVVCGVPSDSHGLGFPREKSQK